jgi:segregation and condensation protein A
MNTGDQTTAAGPEPVDWSDGWIARVAGQPVTELPLDLYIPPDALKIFLEAFEGPLDLLLYLIKKQNLDILDIPIADVTRQYLSYINVMQEMKIELAGEYLLMAAMLAEIKSRMLLPKPKLEEGEEDIDPRAELVRRLQEYERFKQAAEALEKMDHLDRDVFQANVEKPPMELTVAHPDVSFDQVLEALRAVMARAKLFRHHHVQMEGMSIRVRMTDILERVTPGQFYRFETLFTVEEGRMGVVVTLIAVLELIRNSVLELTQEKAYAAIYVKRREQYE